MNYTISNFFISIMSIASLSYVLYRVKSLHNSYIPIFHKLHWVASNVINFVQILVARCQNIIGPFGNSDERSASGSSHIFKLCIRQNMRSLNTSHRSMWQFFGLSKMFRIVQIILRGLTHMIISCNIYTSVHARN